MKHSVPHLRLLISFGLVAGLIVLLWIIATYSQKMSHNALDIVLQNSHLVRLAKKGVNNMAMAGQLAKKLETASTDIKSFQAEIKDYHTRFHGIITSLQNSEQSQESRSQAINFQNAGEDFFITMDEFFPIKKKILDLTTKYKGENRPIFDVISQRELAHIWYVRAMRTSVQERKVKVLTYDYKQCAFHKWYTSTPTQDEDIMEVFREIDPLHRKLHAFAGKISNFISQNEIAKAEQVLLQAETTLSTLGRYFSGLRELSYLKYMQAKKEYSTKLATLDENYIHALQSARDFENTIKNTDLKHALDNMAQTESRSSFLIRLFAFLGIGLTIIIAIISTKLNIMAFASQEKANREQQRTLQDLVGTREELLKTEKFAVLGQMSGIIAHEVLNPISTTSLRIETNIDMAYQSLKVLEKLRNTISKVKDKLQENDPDVVYLEKISSALEEYQQDRLQDFTFLEKQTLRIIKIIDSLRQMARTQQHLERINLGDLINDIIADVSESLIKRGIELQYDLSPVPDMVADHMELYAIISNLLRNSMDAIDKVNAAEKNIIITLRQKDEAVILIDIKDTGIGVEADKWDYIFEAEFTSKGREGTGLGLSYSRKIARSYNGDIKILESKKGLGTTMQVSLDIYTHGAIENEINSAKGE